MRILFSTRNLPRQFAELSLPLRQIPAQIFSRLITNKKKVSEINAAVIRMLWVKKYLASAEQQKQQGNFVFCHLESVPRHILPRLHSEAYCACVCHFPCAYTTSVNTAGMFCRLQVAGCRLKFNFN